ncbi:DMT family transporter [Longitalea luteola]|uniref:DMT family transporter n=1 Tax=Longitalea luteola TaxID=2812563 RepID=UPI001F625430|nr:DMT family transporter [Longitalea luteola]
MKQQEDSGIKKRSTGWLWFLTGTGFAILWPSAAVATKFGLQHAQPFVICILRFFIAGLLMLLLAHGVLRKRLPQKNEWKQLAIYGLLNISLYLGLYVLAMRNVSAGLGSLAIATNPVLINLMASLIFGHRLRIITIISLVLCMTGVLLAAWPLFTHSYATPGGISLLMLCMVIYSAGVIYFSRQNWGDLHILTINGWQTLLGGVFLVPAVIATYNPAKNNWGFNMLAPILWLAIPVSILGVQLWLYLLKDNAVKASFWLFLCPVFGFVIAGIMMNEPISFFTITGMLLTLSGLYLVQKYKSE